MTGHGSLLILLLGGRIQPVITTALRLRPDVIGLVCSESEPRHLETARGALARLLPDAAFLPFACVAPGEVGPTRAAVTEILRTAGDLMPAVSVTSAPVPMTIGAYEAARNFGPVYYRPAGATVLLDLTERFAPQPVSLNIGVVQYLAMYGLTPDPAHKPKYDRLESIVYEAGRRLCGAQERVFDECHSSYGFLISGAKRELDFIGITGDMPLIGSCKTGKSSWLKKDLDELEAWGNMLGGKNCVLLYASDQPAPGPDHEFRQRYTQFLRNAVKMRVVVVTGDDLDRLDEILRREQLKPTYPRQ